MVKLDEGVELEFRGARLGDRRRAGAAAWEGTRVSRTFHVTGFARRGASSTRTDRLANAWRLLLLRTLARDAADEPAENALTPTQLAVLRATSKRQLPPNPTVRDAMLAVAGLGGHIKNNGEPGWAVLGRGFHKLLAREEGWIAALNARSDPS